MPGTFDGRVAFASILYPAPGAPDFRTQSGDFASVSVVGGVARLVFQDPIAPYQGFASLTVRASTAGIATIVDWTDAYVEVETADATGAPTELAFDLTIVTQNVAFVVPPAPPPPPPGPALTDLISWWRADDLAQPDGSNVTTWTDRSGAGIVLTPTAFFDPPSLVAVTPTLNNQPSVYFENRNEALYSINPPNYPVGSGAFTAYAVHDPIVGTSPLMTMIGWGAANVQKRMALSLFPSWSVAADGFASGSSAFVGTIAPQITSISCGNGQNMQDAVILVDGTAPALLGVGSAVPWDINNPCEQVRMGGLPQDNAAWYFGRIAEVLIYRKAHSPAERAQTLAYLSARYAIPVLS